MDNIHITYFDQDINITAYEQVNILLKIQKTNLEKKSYMELIIFSGSQLN